MATGAAPTRTAPRTAIANELGELARLANPPCVIRAEGITGEMKKGDLIAVYGTLRRGERAALDKGFYSYGVDFIGADRISAKMYHLGSFPGVKSVTDFDETLPTVVVEVFRIRDASIIAILDAYESYNSEQPTQGLYNRCQVETERGRTAWVYTFNGMVIEDQRIDGGDWCKNRDTVQPRQLRRA